jgi:hypothetical protein
MVVRQPVPGPPPSDRGGAQPPGDIEAVGTVEGSGDQDTSPHSLARRLKRGAGQRASHHRPCGRRRFGEPTINVTLCFHDVPPDVGAGSPIAGRLAVDLRRETVPEDEINSAVRTTPFSSVHGSCAVPVLTREVDAGCWMSANGAVAACPARRSAEDEFVRSAEVPVGTIGAARQRGQWHWHPSSPNRGRGGRAGTCPVAVLATHRRRHEPDRS